jgi:hypothetical protein
MKEFVDIANYLAANGCGRVAGINRNIFVNHMPATVKEGVMIRQDYEGIPYQHELPGYFRAAFQVIVRNPDYVSGQTLAEKIATTLNKERVVFGTTNIKYIRPIQKPIVFPASSGDYLEFSTYFDVCYSVTS